MSLRQNSIDKKLVKEALVRLQRHIGKKGVNLAIWDHIEEIKKELNLDEVDKVESKN